MPATVTKLRKPSKHSQVVSEIRSQIASGLWQPGQRLPSFAEMRARFGVSPATIDRIYAVLEQEGLVVRQQGRGIFVAQAEPKTTKGIVGFLGPADTKLRYFPYWAHLLDGIQEVAHEANFEVLLLNAAGDPAWEKMDGVLAHGDAADDTLASLPDIMPAVAMMSSSAIVPSVVADDMTGSMEAVQHLLALGHRHIGCLMLTQTPLPQRRIAGYHAALQQAGIHPRPEWIRSVQFPGGDLALRALGRWNMEQWLLDGWRETGCTALLVQNDRMALGVLDALRAASLKVPQEVSVIGFDGTEEGEEATPRLTSVQVPLQKIGATAMRTLLRRINGHSDEHSITMLPTQLQIRETTGPLNSAHPPTQIER